MKQRDLELLSSYLDGQLSSSDVTRLEARLLTDPELHSVLRDLRSARSVLRQLPMRKAPRNFTLTPQMVGKNPPLPRAYPAFRFTTALATLLLFISFGLNFLRPQLATVQSPFGMGGGGGAAETTLSVESAPAVQAPAATEAPAATQAPAATEAPTEAPSVAMAPMATMTAPAAEDTARAADTAVAKNNEPAVGMGGGLEQPQVPPQAPPARSLPVVSPAWQWIFAGVAILSAFIMALMRQLSINHWRKK